MPFLQGRQLVFLAHQVPTENGSKKVREKSRECHNHKPQPFPDPKRKRKPTNVNKHKPNKRTKSTKISSLFPKRGNRNTKRTEKHKNKMTHGKTYNKSTLNGKRFLTGRANSFPLKKIPSQKEDSIILIENTTSNQDLLCLHATHDNYKRNNQPPFYWKRTGLKSQSRRDHSA